jgi:hypothetical protein
LRQQLGSTWSDIAEGRVPQVKPKTRSKQTADRPEKKLARAQNKPVSKSVSKSDTSFKEKSHKEKSQSDKPPKNLPEKNVTPWKMSETKTTSKKKTLKLKNK